MLTQEADLDPVTMTRLVEILDDIHRFYQHATDRLPDEYKNHQGRMVIAEAENEFGETTANFGYAGIEMEPAVFLEIYDELQESGRMTPDLAYQFGRCFWGLADILGYQGDEKGDVVNEGFATLDAVLVDRGRRSESGSLRRPQLGAVSTGDRVPRVLLSGGPQG